MVITEIRCDWTERYPIDSCPTRITTENGDRMDRSNIILDNKYKYTRKPKTLEQKQRDNARGRGHRVMLHKYKQSDLPDEL